MDLRRIQKVFKHGGSKVLVVPPDSDLEVGDAVVVTYGEKGLRVRSLERDDEETS